MTLQEHVGAPSSIVWIAGSSTNACTLGRAIDRAYFEEVLDDRDAASRFLEEHGVPANVPPEDGPHFRFHALCEEDYRRCPYLRTQSTQHGVSHGLLVLLFVGGALSGFVILERRPADPRFGRSDRDAVAQLAPLIAAGMSLQADQERLASEVASLRPLVPHGNDVCLPAEQTGSARTGGDPAATAPVVSSLSRRERQIAGLLASGYSTINAAAISGLTENTIRTYIRRLYAKLGVGNRADLARVLIGLEVDEPVDVDRWERLRA